MSASAGIRVSGGAVVTPGGTVVADMLIEGGRILSIGEDDDSTGSRQVLDASGCFVIPGGVDAHVHLMEDLAAGTRAALLGGSTTVLSFTNPQDGEGDLESLFRCQAEVDDRGPFVDVGLHTMLYEPDRVSSEELLAVRNAGSSAVKVFLAYPELGIMWSTRGLFRLMRAARHLGQIVQVHCENGFLIECLIEEAAAARRFGTHSFVETRPPEVEADSVGTTLAVAGLTGASCYLVHLSSANAVDLVRIAKRRGGVATMAETCVHYLVLNDGAYVGDHPERFLVAPPLRSSSHQDDLWEAVADGTIDAVGSDHCQVRSSALHELSETGDGFEYGLAGVGARLPMLLSEGLARGVSIERLVEVGCSQPARAFRHFAKGALAPGADADIVVFDPNGTRILDETAFDDGTGGSVYAGTRLRGSFRFVIARGQVAVCEGRLVADGRTGRFLPAAGIGN